jgi:dCMP deaminase
MKKINQNIESVYKPTAQDFRPTFSHILLETCMVWRKRSTCQRIQTAALIVKNNNILSIGYNGVPHSQKHCTNFWQEFYNCAKGIAKQPDADLQKFYLSAIQELKFDVSVMSNIHTYEQFIASDIFKILHHNWSDKNELHAELNAILQSESIVHGATMYTLYGPCRQCAKSIISAKIVQVVYHEDYHRDLEGIDLLYRHGVIIEKI